MTGLLSYRILLQKLLPQHMLSRLSGAIAHCRHPRFKNWMIKKFIEAYHVNMDEAAESDYTKYIDANSFFTRALRSDCRPIVSGLHTIASPADGTISEFGLIESETLIQAKGVHYSLAALLAGNEALTKTFSQGATVTLYLGPKDYHRVHMPLAGTLQEMIYVPGKLFSVNQETAAAIPNLFARNERVISIFETAFGKMAVILVGAFFVGSIETVWAGTVAPQNIRFAHHSRFSDERAIHLEKGQEMGRFKFGSTVILLFENAHLSWSNAVSINTALKMGSILGNFPLENKTEEKV